MTYVQGIVWSRDIRRDQHCRAISQRSYSILSPYVCHRTDCAWQHGYVVLNSYFPPRRHLSVSRGDKSAYTSKQKRQARHIEEGYEDHGVSKKESESRAWATVNKHDGGGKKKVARHKAAKITAADKNNSVKRNKRPTKKASRILTRDGSTASRRST